MTKQQSHKGTSHRSVIAIVAARAGSKGLPGKNTLPLCGKPLVSWTLDAAAEANGIDEIRVTSDDKMVMKLGEKIGAICIDRPAELATDTASIIDVIFHALSYPPHPKDEDILVLLQPTSPLRTVEHIDAALHTFNSSSEIRSLISVCQHDYHPLKMLMRDSDGYISTVSSDVRQLAMGRQDLPQAYRQNGAIYIVGIGGFRKHKTFFIEPCIPLEMSEVESTDIDTRKDFEKVENYLSQG